MSIETGFWSSNNHDRQYSADDLNGMFDGIVDSGVFETIGTHFEVTATTGNTINVGIGKCRFNKHTLNNTALLPLTLDDSEVALGRIDAVVVEINDSDIARSGAIKIVNGTASSTPVRPTMTDVGEGVKGIHQYALAYITRAAASSSIVTSDITNVVGEEATPYISGMSGSGVEVGPTAPTSPTAKSWVDTSVESEGGTFTDFFDQYTTDKGREYGQLVDDVEAQEGEIQIPTLRNGWHNFGVSFEDAGYYKKGNTVFLKGFVGGGNAWNDSMFGLPEGYRPQKTHGQLVPLAAGMGLLYIGADGTVCLASVYEGNATNYTVIGGVNFRVAD